MTTSSRMGCKITSSAGRASGRMDRMDRMGRMGRKMFDRVAKAVSGREAAKLID